MTTRNPPIPTSPLPYSLLDLSPIPAGLTPAHSFRSSLDLAQHAERWGYHRYWLAEHHNIPGIASAATSVVISHIAAGTSTIRVGSGGIMLPNHAPLVIAEQFGTLESLYPGRIDLGIGRAPGGDPATARALRRHLPGADSFPQDLRELLSYFRPRDPRLATAPQGRPSLATVPQVRAIPGHNLNVPLYLLGSSDFSARLAATLGLPFAFASHFAPDYLHAALELYRSLFQPSPDLAKPYAMVTVNILAADTDAEARRLFTSLQLAFLNLLRGHPVELPPPLDNPDSLPSLMSPIERDRVDHMTHYSLVGSPDTIRTGLTQLLADTQADEIIATANIHDHAARLRSFELAADVFRHLRTAMPAGAK